MYMNFPMIAIAEFLQPYFNYVAFGVGALLIAYVLWNSRQSRKAEEKISE